MSGRGKGDLKSAKRGRKEGSQLYDVALSPTERAQGRIDFGKENRKSVPCPLLCEGRLTAVAPNLV